MLFKGQKIKKSCQEHWLSLLERQVRVSGRGPSPIYVFILHWRLLFTLHKQVQSALKSFLKTPTVCVFAAVDVRRLLPTGLVQFAGCADIQMVPASVLETWWPVSWWSSWALWPQGTLHPSLECEIENLLSLVVSDSGPGNQSGF